MIDNKRREFERVQPFDIIWAKREVEDIESFDDEKVYEGSYIVIGRDKDKLYCLRGTQKIKDYYDPYMVFSRLIKNKNGLEKIVYYIDIDVREVDYDNFINKKTRLNVEEKRDLVCDIKKQGNLIDKKYCDIDLSIKTGDIIKKGDKLYFVIHKYGDKLQCLELYEDRDLENSFYINDIKYINYNDVKILKVNDEIKFINIISRELFEKIFSTFKELNYDFVNYLNKQRNMQEGLLIEKDKIQYYVSKVESELLICNEVKESDDNEKSNLQVNGINYCADYLKDIIINIKDDFRILALATNEEKRQNYLNYDKIKEDLRKIRDSLSDGMVFKINNNSYDYYLFIEKVGNKVKCINLLDLNRNEFEFNYIDINEIIYVDNIIELEVKKNKKKIKCLLKNEEKQEF